MTCMPTTYEGYKAAIGWYCAERIVGQFDRGYAASKARMAADPTYKPNPFADKPGAKTTPKTTADAIAAIKANVAARRAGK